MSQSVEELRVKLDLLEAAAEGVRNAIKRAESPVKTMRVTLEFTGRFDKPPAEWPWADILAAKCRMTQEEGDSWRVVPDGEKIEVRFETKYPWGMNWEGRYKDLIKALTGRNIHVFDNH